MQILFLQEIENHILLRLGIMEEDILLLKLKEKENLPWRVIAVRFQTGMGKFYEMSALQMRYKRLRERIRALTRTDSHV